MTALKRVVLFGISICLRIFRKLIGIDRIYKSYRYTSSDDIPSNVRYCMILGARLFDDDSITPMLIRRMDAAIDLYRKRPGMIFILSGDGSKRVSNDVKAMYDYFKQHCDIPDKQILLDNHGFTTLDSMKNISPEVDASGFILLTGAFHMPRSVYICHRLGLHPFALHLPAMTSKYQKMQELREGLAVLKTWYILTFGASKSHMVMHRLGFILSLAAGKAMIFFSRLLALPYSYKSGKLALLICPYMFRYLTSCISLTLIAGTGEKAALCAQLANTARLNGEKVFSNPSEDGSRHEIATTFIRHSRLCRKSLNAHAIFTCGEKDFFKTAQYCASPNTRIYITGLVGDTQELTFNRILSGIDYQPHASIYLNIDSPELTQIESLVKNPIDFYNPACR